MHNHRADEGPERVDAGVDLSWREDQILHLAALGHTDKAIANQLGISQSTVSTYWGRLRIKVGPFSRTELVATVLRSAFDGEVARLKAEHERTLQAARAPIVGDVSRNEFYARVVLSAPDALLLVSDRGTVIVANVAAGLLFGFTPEEMEGMPIKTLVPDRLRPSHEGHVTAYLAHPERRQMAESVCTFAVDKDGQEFPVVVALSSIESDDEVVVICTVRRREDICTVRYRF